ncbi:MAG: hypothetical protein FH749_01695 [Firmicutes bacterium]|nr:hypothetical protein [Bacillota bacterium]
MKRYSFHPRGRLICYIFLILLGPLIALAGMLAGTRVGLTHFLPIYGVVSLIFVLEIFQHLTVTNEGIEYYSLTKRARLSWDQIKTVELRQIGHRQALCFAVKPVVRPRPEAISADFIMTYNPDPVLLAWIKQRWGQIDGLESKEKSA